MRRTKTRCAGRVQVGFHAETTLLDLVARSRLLQVAFIWSIHKGRVVFNGPEAPVNTCARMRICKKPANCSFNTSAASPHSLGSCALSLSVRGQAVLQLPKREREHGFWYVACKKILRCTTVGAVNCILYSTRSHVLNAQRGFVRNQEPQLEYVLGPLEAQYGLWSLDGRRARHRNAVLSADWHAHLRGDLVEAVDFSKLSVAPWAAAAPRVV